MPSKKLLAIFLLVESATLRHLISRAISVCANRKGERAHDLPSLPERKDQANQYFVASRINVDSCNHQSFDCDALGEGEREQELPKEGVK
jgi:hypothetical protein